ncbi:MAG: hypothetical protein Q8Q08_12795 [Candidatus Omnitrophota bacterium]|nr:hypothetical protein [Candidatus Omnitrophota bacterium]
MTKQYLQIKLAPTTVDKEAFTVEGVFSTMDTDRHGDVVLQNWELDAYLRNPVVLNSHNYGDAAEIVARMLDIGVVDNKLQGKMEFAVKENPKAKVIFDLIAGGFANAFSAGFIVLEFGPNGEILKSELLEVSVVSVPANSMAVAKAKGIDVDALEPRAEEDEEEVEPEEDEDPETRTCAACDAEVEGEPVVAKLGPLTVKICAECAAKAVPPAKVKRAKPANKKLVILRAMEGMVKDLGEKEKVDTRRAARDVRAETRRIANKIIRNLIQERKKL